MIEGRWTKRTLAWLILVACMTSDGRPEAGNFIRIAPEPAHYAWWMRAQFFPFEVQVRGIPVNKIRASWCKATEFRKDLFPSHIASELDQDLSFSVDGFFDGSTVRHTALVGVYETCSGERGAFLLILARPNGKPPAIRFIHEVNEVHFAMLAVSPDATIQMFHCMKCDDVSNFRWDKAQQRFLPFSPEDEDE